jgi:hypothetical protein
MQRTFTLSSVSRSIPSCWQLAEPMSTISDWTSKGPSTKCWKPYLGIKSTSRYGTIFYICLNYLFFIYFFVCGNFLNLYYVKDFDGGVESHPGRRARLNSFDGEQQIQKVSHD